LETTIPSYLTSWPSRDLIIAAHQQVTREWWKKRKSSFEICISQLVVDEVKAGDDEAVRERLKVIDGMPLLDITYEVERVARRILVSGLILLRQFTKSSLFPLWQRGKLLSPSLEKRGEGRFSDQTAQHIHLASRHKRYLSE
jgi:hypothetical protein